MPERAFYGFYAAKTLSSYSAFWLITTATTARICRHFVQGRSTFGRSLRHRFTFTQNRARAILILSDETPRSSHGALKCRNKDFVARYLQAPPGEETNLNSELANL